MEKIKLYTVFLLEGKENKNKKINIKYLLWSFKCVCVCVCVFALGSRSRLIKDEFTESLNNSVCLSKTYRDLTSFNSINGTV